MGILKIFLKGQKMTTKYRRDLEWLLGIPCDCSQQVCYIIKVLTQGFLCKCSNCGKEFIQK